MYVVCNIIFCAPQQKLCWMREEKKTLIIPKFLCSAHMSRGMALGNNFIGEYLPMIAKKKKREHSFHTTKRRTKSKKLKFHFSTLRWSQIQMFKRLFSPGKQFKKMWPIKKQRSDISFTNNLNENFSENLFNCRIVANDFLKFN